MSYSAYVLSSVSRALILERLSPRFPEVIAHHITYRFPDKELPPPVETIEVIGYAGDERVECLVVQVDGQTDRPHGGTFHITLSLDREQGAKPVHSNHLLKAGWSPIDPFHLEVSPELIQHHPRPQRR